MSAITWLHISDLHWKDSSSYEQNMVAKRLLEDLRQRQRIAPELARIDLIFVTGDIAFASRPREYRLARRFFSDLMSVTGVSQERFFVVPGNHDVDRRRADLPAAKAIVGSLDSLSAVNALLGDRRRLGILTRRFDNYARFVNRSLPQHPRFSRERFFYARRLEVERTQLVVVGLNSAWVSASDQDRSNLFLGERQVHDALETATASPNDVCIALLHHPFEWLQESDGHICEALLLRACQFILHGHAHRTDMGRTIRPGASALLLDAGSLYPGNETAKTYKLVHLDTNAGRATVYLREYSPADGGFWVADVRSYRDAPGQFTWPLPPRPAAEAPTPVTVVAVSQPREAQPPMETGSATAPTATVAVSQRGPAQATPAHTYLQWWQNHGFTGLPLAYADAEQQASSDLANHLSIWYVDPDAKPPEHGFIEIPNPESRLTEIPTLERALTRTASLVLVFGPVGGGKTFYRRAAAEELTHDDPHPQVIELQHFVARASRAPRVTGAVLARAIYDEMCEERPADAQDLPGDATMSEILDTCERTCRLATGGKAKTFVFLDDLGKLLDRPEARSRHDRQMLEGFVQLCRGMLTMPIGPDGPSLALRIFVPAALKQRIQDSLSEQDWKRIPHFDLAWTAAHCEAVVENRLQSCLAPKKEEDSGPSQPAPCAQSPVRELADPNGVGSCLFELLTPDVYTEFMRWLKGRKAATPRGAIELLDNLAYGAWKDSIGRGQIGLATWKRVTAPLPRACPFRRYLHGIPGKAALGIVFGALLYLLAMWGRLVLPALSWARTALGWIARAIELIGAALAGIVLLGSVLFVPLCLFARLRSGERPSWKQCLQEAWRAISERVV
jgi:predicted phosphodiesterase